MNQDDHSTLPQPIEPPKQGPAPVPQPGQPASQQVSPALSSSPAQPVRPREQQAMQRPAPFPQYAQPVPMPTPQPSPRPTEQTATDRPQPRPYAPQPVQPAGQPQYPAQPAPQPQSRPVQPAQPQQPARPAGYTTPTYTQNQPTYASPFPAAPQRPTHPYQPLTPNPAPNPYWASPELPQVSENMPASQKQPASQPQQRPQPAPAARPTQTQPAPHMPPIGGPSPASHSSATKHRSSNKKKLFIVVALVLCALVAGAAAWWYTTQIAGDKQPAKQQPAVTQPEKQEEPQEPADETPKVTTEGVSSLPMLSFTGPVDIPETFKPFDYKRAGVNAYVTEDKTCELQYGVLAASVLPGDNPADIVNRQIAAIRDNGAEAEDATKTDELTLKNADDANKEYTMESFVVSGTLKNGNAFRSYYSVGILKSGDRAYVLRSCNAAETVNDEAMRDVEKLADSLTIKPAQ